MMNRPDIRLLVTEDDEDDFFLLQKAFQINGLEHPLQRLNDGEELLAFLRTYEPGRSESLFILLDLNLPKIDGRSCLEAIKSNDLTKKIPVVILTTSDSPDDIEFCYRAGANGYVTKPPRMNLLVDAVRNLYKFWLDTSILPRFV